MLKYIITICLLLTCLVTNSFAENNLIVSTLTSQDKDYENRIAIVPHVEYGKLFYNGDYNLDYNKEYDATRSQLKTLIGVNVYKGLSLRYQYENYSMDKFLTIRGRESIKNIQFEETRVGVGYNKVFKIGDVKLVNDIMILKEEIQNVRTEYVATLFYKNILIRNQIYLDFDSHYARQKYFEKVIVTYKFTDNFGVTWHSNWVTGADDSHRVGFVFLF